MNVNWHNIHFDHGPTVGGNTFDRDVDAFARAFARRAAEAASPKEKRERHLNPGAVTIGEPSTFKRGADHLDDARGFVVLRADGTRSKPIAGNNETVDEILYQFRDNPFVIGIEPVREMVSGGACQINGVTP